MSENMNMLPDTLKLNLENLSGFDMSDVKVHYNSDKPAQLLAHAYAQGNQIHLGPGQEEHLPHLAWHVVQQKQGRIRATAEIKVGVPDSGVDAELQQEAQSMAAKLSE